MILRTMLLRFYSLMSGQLGIDPVKAARSFRGLPRFLGNLYRFHRNYTGRIRVVPCLQDWYEEGGTTMSEYFWQDLLVARMVYAAKPERHVAIGSRVDGFVAHVASFRDIEVFDLRPIPAKIPGVIFRQADLMKPIEGLEGYCDSLSCLHALEHFGLGRYGDPIDPSGFERGLCNMASLLTKGGIFYLSVPIGIDRVEFNANRVFDPRIIYRLALRNSLQLSALTVIWQDGRVEPVAYSEAQFSDLASQRML